MLVSAAINDLLTILFTILSNVGIWGLGVRGVLTFDDKAGEIGVVGMGWKFAERVANGEIVCSARGVWGNRGWIRGAGRFLDSNSCYALFRRRFNLISSDMVWFLSENFPKCEEDFE